MRTRFVTLVLGFALLGFVSLQPSAFCQETNQVGMLSAVAEKRYLAGEKLCREALEMKWNHAQLYLNLAEVSYERKKGFCGSALRARRMWASATPLCPSRRRLRHFANSTTPIPVSECRPISSNMWLFPLRRVFDLSSETNASCWPTSCVRHGQTVQSFTVLWDRPRCL
jgi:hypothetical protein